MRFVVTGGAGFIGSYITNLLLKKNYEVIVIDNLRTGKLENIHESSKSQFYQIDIRDSASIERKLENIDGIFHNAALTLVPESFKNPLEYEEVNIKGTKNIFKIAKKLGIKIVYASSSSVYGEVNEIPIKESFPKNPTSPYGKTKLENDILAQKFSQGGLSIIGLRYFNVFGKGQTGTYAGVITKFLERLQENKDPIIYGDGKQIRDFVYVEDVANANLKAMFSDTKKGIFNIGTGIPTTIFELAKLMIKLSEQKLTINFQESRIGDIKISLADISHAQKILKWRPEITLKEGICKIMK